MSQKGKTVLITSSTDGSGKMLARHFAEAEGNNILYRRNEMKGDVVVQEPRWQTRNKILFLPER